jgi:DUF4097 and DUF4098 domain-containing protein YvlB
MKFATFVLLTGIVSAQDTGVDRVTVPFSDPARPRRLVVSLLTGGITVKAHANKDAIVEARSRGSRGGQAERSGLRRLDVNTTGLNVEESENTIEVGTGAMNRAVDITVFVPAETNVKLRATNNGNIEVEGITGEIDANCLNGGVTITNVAGAVLAHSLNGKVLVTLNRVTPNKPMSFSTLNGDVDVTLPADAKANLKLKSENGDIYSDFEITLNPTTREPVVKGTSGKGKYKVSFDRAMTGTINGGGPEMQFTTLNGRIYIRKK